MTRLKTGDIAPAFHSAIYGGGKVHLEFPKPCRYWLIFYRYAACPLCNMHLFDVIRYYELLRRHKVQVIAIFNSRLEKFPDEMAKTGDRLFPYLSDPERDIYKLYGVKRQVSSAFDPRTAMGFAKALSAGFQQPVPDGEFFQVPGHFLVEPNGEIYEAFYGRHMNDHVSWDVIERFVARPLDDQDPTSVPRVSINYEYSETEKIIDTTKKDYSPAEMEKIVANYKKKYPKEVVEYDFGPDTETDLDLEIESE